MPRIVEGSCPEFLLDPGRYSKYLMSQRGSAGEGESSDNNEAFRTALVEYMSSARININVRQLARVETPEQLARLIAERSGMRSRLRCRPCSAFGRPGRHHRSPTSGKLVPFRARHLLQRQPAHRENDETGW